MWVVHPLLIIGKSCTKMRLWITAPCLLTIRWFLGSIVGICTFSWILGSLVKVSRDDEVCRKDFLGREIRALTVLYDDHNNQYENAPVDYCTLSARHPLVLEESCWCLCLLLDLGESW